MVWNAITDDHGRVYYFNSETNTSTWEKPIELLSNLEKALLKSNWKQYTAEEGKTYYFNEKTQETVWDLPEDIQLLIDEAEGKSNEQGNDDEEVDEGTSQGVELSDPLLNLPKFASLADVEEAFIDILRSHQVDATWSFSKVMNTFITNPIYWSVPDSLRRKELFESYLANRTKEELLKESNSKEKFREAFLQVLNNYDDIKYYTRWSTAKKLISDEPIYLHTAIGEKEIKAMFEEYVSHLRSNYTERKLAQRGQALHELSEYFNSLHLKITDNWKDVLYRIKTDPRFQANKNFKGVLNKLDILNLYEKHLEILENNLIEELDSLEKKNYRSDRKARDNYKDLLQDLKKRGIINANTQFKDIFSILEQEDAFIEICGREGSSPLELFWDIVDEEDQLLKIKKDIVSTILIENDFAVERKTKQEFREFISSLNDTRLKEIDFKVTQSEVEDELGIIYSKLIRDIELREEENRLALKRNIKRAEEKLSYYLLDHYEELKLKPTDDFESARSHIEEIDEYKRLFEFSQSGSLELHREAYESFIKKLIELENNKKNEILRKVSAKEPAVDRSKRTDRKRRASEVEAVQMVLDY